MRLRHVVRHDCCLLTVVHLRHGLVHVAPGPNFAVLISGRKPPGKHGTACCCGKKKLNIIAGDIRDGGNELGGLVDSGEIADGGVTGILGVANAHCRSSHSCRI